MIVKGRGAQTNPQDRFAPTSCELVDDDWGGLTASMAARAEKSANRTELFVDKNRTIITTNTSPDLPFEQSINPYQGCEHGCVYCYARPSHNYWGHSSGLDFERKIYAKADPQNQLRAALDKPSYQCQVISIGSNTDPYQPYERDLKITRSILEILADYRHPVGIVTKSAGIVRDIDILQDLARDGLVHVYLSITTLDTELARKLEPRASTPAKRLQAMAQLSTANIPVGVFMAPVIPGLTDHEIEPLINAAADAGAIQANAILLRLPYDVKDLFETWLETHFPSRKARVLSLLRQCRQGKLNDPNFHSRMRGSGPIADLIHQRFAKARAANGLHQRVLPMRTDLFKRPGADEQLSLFA